MLFFGDDISCCRRDYDCPACAQVASLDAIGKRARRAYVTGIFEMKSRDATENPISLWNSVNLGATLCYKSNVSQRHTEVSRRATEKEF